MTRRRFWFLIVGSACLLVTALAYRFRAIVFHDEDPFRNGQIDEESNPVPGSAPASILRSTAASKQFVGTSECATCHSDQHQSYLLTSHSRAMGLVDPDDEPEDGGFSHELSNRHYRVYRQDGNLWHAESSAPSAETEPAVAGQGSLREAKEPVKYLVGSGRHSRTYLVEQDGFLMESPITWYSSTRNWSMSPGYDHAHHEGFERAADLGCLVCHVGRADPIDGALNRLMISETAIGCEQCHGPGSVHVAKWKDRSEVPSQSDRTPDESIVHPGRLSRDLKEAICSQCHLRGDATVVRRGKLVSDFYPGTPLTDTRIDYHLASAQSEMKVVGHVDQMHAGRCYQQSSTMTCTTCHDSHAENVPTLASGYYRNKCIECHSDSGCGLSLAERQQQDASDNCVRCHMPQVPTDIPHIAFTHHRIGIHTESKPSGTADEFSGHLAPMGDLSGLSEDERRRCLGLAYAEIADKLSNANLANEYRSRAFRILKDAAVHRECDGDVFATLARFAWEDEEPQLALEYAQRALENRDLSVKARLNSLFIVGDCSLQAKQSALAIAPFEQLVKLRRNSEDWLLLGISRFQSGQRSSGIAAVKQATLIQPFREDLHSTLDDMQRAAGE